MNSRWAQITGSTKARAFGSLAVMLMLFNHVSDAGTFLWPEDTDPSLIPYASQLSRRADDEIKSTRKSRPAARPRAAAIDEDQRTEGDFCAACQMPKRRAGAPDRLKGRKFAQLERATPAGDGKLTEKELCFSNAIFEAAKARTRRVYGNRGSSRGACAVGVRGHLGAAGVYDGHSLGGGAIDYSSSGKLEAQGLRNRLSEFPTPEAAPKGAVLVFAGPASHEYITNKIKIYGGKCHGRGRHRKCGDAGNWAGHITIAGEKTGGGRWYYTDGRTPQPAIGWPWNKEKRRLVGVYVMEKCGPDCSPALRNKCGG